MILIRLCLPAEYIFHFSCPHVFNYSACPAIRTPELETLDLKLGQFPYKPHSWLGVSKKSRCNSVLKMEFWLIIKNGT